jgi:hypothetical protein
LVPATASAAFQLVSRPARMSAALAATNNMAAPKAHRYERLTIRRDGSTRMKSLS